MPESPVSLAFCAMAEQIASQLLPNNTEIEARQPVPEHEVDAKKGDVIDNERKD